MRVSGCAQLRIIRPENGSALWGESHLIMCILMLPFPAALPRALTGLELERHWERGTAQIHRTVCSGGSGLLDPTFPSFFHPFPLTFPTVRHTTNLQASAGRQPSRGICCSTSSSPPPNCDQQLGDANKGSSTNTGSKPSENVNIHSTQRPKISGLGIVQL